MKSFRWVLFFDILGVGLSFLCLVHCLLLPLMLSFLPAILSAFSQNEQSHFILGTLIVPVSFLAIIPGYFKHRKKGVVLNMVVGLVLIVGAVLFGHDFFGEMGEKIMTLTGGIFLITAHILNRSFCHSCSKCKTDDTQGDFFSSHF